MTADALKKITTDALDKLAALLDEGHSEQLTALLKTMARFHKYSWHNVCLIASQRPTATRVAGFQTWRTMGRFVRKGEKGIAIMAPIVGRREAESEGDNARTVRGLPRGVRVRRRADRRRAAAERRARPQVIPAPRRLCSRRRFSDRASPSNRSTTLAAHWARRAADAFGSSTVSRPRRSSRPSFTNTRTNCCTARTTDRPRATRENSKRRPWPSSSAGQWDSTRPTRHATTFILYRGDREALAGSLDRIQRAASVILGAINAAG